MGTTSDPLPTLLPTDPGFRDPCRNARADNAPTIATVMPPEHPTQAEYEHLLQFRTRLRLFLRWSEEQASAQGLNPAQHQLLLAIRGHPGSVPPSIGDDALSELHMREVSRLTDLMGALFEDGSSD
jgi:hypothetical protein